MSGKSSYSEQHYLNVHQHEDGFDREVEHPLGCPIEKREWDGELGEKHSYEEYTCLVGYIVGQYGFEDLQENDPEELLTTPGRHKIAGYAYTPDSFFEDGELYLYFGEPENG